jgi:transcription elongation factor GreB
MNKLNPANVYLTPRGFQTLKDEFDHLKKKERPEVVNTVAWAAGNGDRSENGDYIYGKKRLREIDRRLAFLNSRLTKAEVIDPCRVPYKAVYFGASVTIKEEDDETKTYMIVGEDEIDLGAGKVSWKSPLGSALLYKCVDDWATIRAPKGTREVQIIDITYPKD